MWPEAVDFVTQDCGSVIIFTPMTEDAKVAMDEMPLEDWQMWGEGFAVDRRIAMDLMDALLDNGLMVQ